MEFIDFQTSWLYTKTKFIIRTNSNTNIPQHKQTPSIQNFINKKIRIQTPRSLGGNYNNTIKFSNSYLTVNEMFILEEYSLSSPLISLFLQLTLKYCSWTWVHLVQSSIMCCTFPMEWPQLQFLDFPNFLCQKSGNTTCSVTT